ncbi:MAG: acetyltransferase, partial [Gammaproteobacteria bacterium]|nr:acetyltransferase [Gammaproteobacteria bacterium]
YISMRNHKSWVDILMFGPAFNYSAPPTKFFIKQELIWVPVIGFACWAGDMPFMKRYSKETLAKHPELKGKDIETTRQSCAKFRDHPAMVVNFVEGTRFRAEKHAKQQSEYANLLKPKAGGIAYAIQALEDQLDGFVDMDVIYGPEAAELWEVCCGQVNDVHISARVIPMQEWFKGKSYGDDPEYRARFQAWLSEVWRAKDQAISDKKATF